QEDLVATVHDALQNAGLDPAYLHIEITESVFMQDGAREVLLNFRRSGIDISLDDFGTGYSSLSYLTRFPVDKIKLDRSFVRDIAHDTSNAAIIKAVVNLGHSLGMRVNVEGVETADVVSILGAYGVDEIQGYYYSHPLPVDGVAEFLAETAAPPLRVKSRA
ncbi:MAG: EAL domain-containing protein, partial [Rhodospirillales bacterium]